MAPQSNNKTHAVRIWQWNCRGFAKKRCNLQLLVQSVETPPDVIALQETGKAVKFTGYQTFQSNGNHKTAVLIQRNIPASRTQFDSVEIAHDFITILPTKRGATKLFILNVYSNPKAQHHRFNLLFSLARREAGPHTLVVLGDFNAPHTAWGYSKSTKKGNDLWYQAKIHHLTIETEPNTPTRIGNSAQKDSTPDLTFTLHAKQVRWKTTDESLGSDHFIIQTDLELTHAIKRIPQQQHLTDWNKFRDNRESRREEHNTHNPSDIHSWVQQLVNDVKSVTQMTDPEIPLKR